MCIGERKRPVAINHDQNEKKKWFDVIKVAFADVLEEKPIRKPVIQLKVKNSMGNNLSTFKEILFLIEQLCALLMK